MVFKNELPKKRFSLSYKVEIFFDGEVARPADVAPAGKERVEMSIENTRCVIHYQGGGVQKIKDTYLHETSSNLEVT